ncbi:MAG TPA: hypothetical protein VN693_03805 [Rhodanobacteraceae bacterium]|nr:hypothetical protein [Rhodanobacteraceae bacterium]
MLRIMVLMLGASLAGMVVATPPAGGTSSGASPEISRQLSEARAQVDAQHAQTAQLKDKVAALEQTGATQQAQQTQRDREIAELQRKLAALQAASGKAISAAPASAHSAGHR